MYKLLLMFNRLVNLFDRLVVTSQTKKKYKNKYTNSYTQLTAIYFIAEAKRIRKNRKRRNEGAYVDMSSFSRAKFL